MPLHITLLVMMIAAVIVAQTIWILRLMAQIDEMRRTWRPRNTGGKLGWIDAPAPEPATEAIVGEIVTEFEPEPEERQYRVEWGV